MKELTAVLYINSDVEVCDKDSSSGSWPVQLEEWDNLLLNEEWNNLLERPWDKKAWEEDHEFNSELVACGGVSPSTDTK